MQLRTRTKILPIVLLAAGLAWIFLSADRSGTLAGGRPPAPQEGFPAPDFTLATTTGREKTLSELRGQVALVNFWATWCPPCRSEMAAIQEVYDRYMERGFVVLAVNATRQDTLSSIAPFTDEFGLTFPIPLDVSGAVERLYEVKSLPTSFFIDAAGVIREVVIGGPMSEALLQSIVEGLLE